MAFDYKFRIHNNGISLVELMITIGLIAAGSLVISQLNKNQVVSQKKIEESFEVIAVSNIITKSLSMNESCIASIGIGTPIVTGTLINSIKNGAGKAIVETGGSYGGGLVEVLKMEIVGASYGPLLEDEIKGNASLEVTFKKLNKIVQGKSSILRTIKKVFFFNFVTDSTKHLTSCYSPVDRVVDSVLLTACESLGGVLDASNNCILKNYDSSSVSLSDAVSFKAQKDFLDTTLDSRFINVDGDTVNGNLTVSGDITSNSQICINGRCRDFSRVACRPGEVLVEPQNDLSFTCRNLKSVLAEALCPSGDEISLSAAADGSVVFCDNGCSISSWTPGVGDICNGVVFNQSSNCNTTRSATGTKTTQECAPVSACSESDLTEWSPLVIDVCLGETFIQTRSKRIDADCEISSNIQMSRSRRGDKSCCRVIGADDFDSLFALGNCESQGGGSSCECDAQNVTQDDCSSGNSNLCTCVWTESSDTCINYGESGCELDANCEWSP